MRSGKNISSMKLRGKRKLYESTGRLFREDTLMKKHASSVLLHTIRKHKKGENNINVYIYLILKPNTHLSGFLTENKCTDVNCRRALRDPFCKAHL